MKKEVKEGIMYESGIGLNLNFFVIVMDLNNFEFLIIEFYGVV